MIFPELLPDEIFYSYLQRMATINGFKNPMKFRAVLLEHFGINEKSRTAIPFLHHLASILNMEIGEFLHRHTMFPFQLAISKSDQLKLQKTDVPYKSINYATRMLPRRALYYCTSCEYEDVNNYGHMYLRRRHQIPGTGLCHIHREVLAYFSYWDNSVRFPNKNECASIIVANKHPVIRRYLNIANNWLISTDRIHATQLVTVLREQANLRGISMPGSKGQISMRDFALERCPPNWLLSLDEPGMDLHRVLSDRAICSSKPQRYALALALFFRSAEAALSAIKYKHQKQ